MIKIEELVKLAKNGDKDAYTKLILLIKEDMFKVARARLNNEDDIQDAVQNTIINAYVNITKLRNNQYFKTWVTRILINECNRIYKNCKKDNEIIEKYMNYNFDEEYSDEISDFDNIIKTLDENKRKIFELYYKENLSIKEISKLLNISESTVKANLRRGRQKLKETFKHIPLFIIILFVFITTTVIAVSIISYIKSLFETNSVGANNDGILMAIENMDWYQEVNMDYIELGDGYKIKVEYLLMDEMNLYLIFDLQSEEDISKYDNFSIWDLKITNEKNDLICDKGNILNNQIQKHMGDKLIEKKNHNMKLLVYMYTDSFPISKSLNISFFQVSLYYKNIKNTEDLVESYINFEINLVDKFINREYAIYNSNSKIIEKIIVSETGFYSIIKNKKLKKFDAKLIDEEGISYKCFCIPILSNTEENNDDYIVISNFKKKESKKLKLLIKNEIYELVKID